MVRSEEQSVQIQKMIEDSAVERGIDAIDSTAYALKRCIEEVARLRTRYNEAADMKTRIDSLSFLTNQVAQVVGQMNLPSLMDSAVMLAQSSHNERTRR
jgi:hypothetical protein